MSSEASAASPLGSAPSGLPAQAPRPPREPEPVRLTVNYRETTSPVWDISQERLFMETLVNQRFQFFLVFFSIVVAGALNAKVQAHMSIVLCLGAVLSWLLALAIFRAQLKVDTILAMLREDETHPYTIVRNRTGRRFPVRAVIGYYIPSICSIALSVGAVLALCGWLAVAPRQ